MTSSFIIPKNHFKCLIQIESGKKGIRLINTRFVDVSFNESMDMNAKLAKHEYLRIGDIFINCNKLNHMLADCIERAIREEMKEKDQTPPLETKFYLKEEQSYLH